MTSSEQQQATSLAPELLEWVESAMCGRVTYVDRQPGGGRREAWYIDADTSDGATVELFLRYDRSDPRQTGEPFTLHEEAKFLLALQDTDVPVPHVYAVHPTEQAILSSRVRGHPWFSHLRDENDRLAVAREFMTILARLHAVDPHAVSLPGQDPDGDLRDLVRFEIARWEGFYRGMSAPADPLIEFALDWVTRNVPEVRGPVVLVQGDTGPGNFLYADGRVTAVLDWELAHLGDPHDDLAWLTVRAVQEPFTHMPARLHDYRLASGIELDLDRIRYYRVLAELRIVILGHSKADNASPLSEVGNSLIYGALHRRLLVEALAEAIGAPSVDASAVEPTDTGREWLYDAALEQIARIIVPRSTDPFVVQRSKGLARIIKYLRESDRLHDVAQARELDDLETLLGVRCDCVADGRDRLVGAIARREVDEAALIHHFQQSVGRETEVARPAMGALADRHFDVLDESAHAADS